MRVGINKAWHHAQVRSVDHVGSPGGDLADLHDSAIGHRHVRMALWGARAVYHSSVLNEQIIGHVRSSLFYVSRVGVAEKGARAARSPSQGRLTLLQAVPKRQASGQRPPVRFDAPIAPGVRKKPRTKESLRSWSQSWTIQ